MVAGSHRRIRNLQGRLTEETINIQKRTGNDKLKHVLCKRHKTINNTSRLIQAVHTTGFDDMK